MSKNEVIKLPLHYYKIGYDYEHPIEIDDAKPI